MSQVYRAYHAIRGLTNKKGLATNAVYGFTTMLRKLVNDEKPDYLVVAMDPGGRTFRHEQFKEYKSNRRPMPEDLVEQLPYVHKVCEVLGIPVLWIERYEADDVIGSLSKKAEAAGLEVVVVTIDKDMFQLVDDSVKVLDPRTFTYMDSAAVEKKLGVTPRQVVDYLALVGDSSDNVPGAPGIGAKGASQLIRHYGSLNSLLDSTAEITRKTYRESLRNNREIIEKSRDLVEIQRDLDVELDSESFKVSDPDVAAAHQLFTELDFKSLIDEFAGAEDRQETQFEIVADEDGLRRLRDRIRGQTVALGITVRTDDSGRIDLAVSDAEGKAFSLPADVTVGAGSLAKEMFAGAGDWILHDYKSYDLLRMREGWLPDLAGSDIMLMAYLLQPNQNDFSLEAQAKEYLHRSLKGGGDLFDRESQETCDRAALTWSLFQKLHPLMSEEGLESLFREIEMPLVEVLAEMEFTGVRIDREVFARMSEEMGSEIEGLRDRIYSIAGEEFNINSPKQMAEVLFEKLQLPIVKKTRKAGHYSTGVEVLEKLAEEHQIAKLILDYREVSKLKSTYLDALPSLVDPETGRIHTSYNQVVAATGRLSSSNPNLQNIPIKSDQGRKIRQGFVAEDGFQILAADYSQVELRVMAHLSQDQVLLDSFERGEDIHERTAKEVFGMHAVMDPARFRRHAKVINFGIMYGLSAFGLARNLKIERKEAQRYIDDYFQKYSGVKSWIDRTLLEVAEAGQVRTLFGRIRQIPEIFSRNRNIRAFGERTAINAPIQGTAADLIKVAMISIHREMKRRRLGSRMIMQVHDELVFEVEASEVDVMKELVKSRMEAAAELSVPLSVDLAVGPTWYEAK